GDPRPPGCVPGCLPKVLRARLRGGGDVPPSARRLDRRIVRRRPVHTRHAGAIRDRRLRTRGAPRVGAPRDDPPGADRVWTGQWLPGVLPGPPPAWDLPG